MKTNLELIKELPGIKFARRHSLQEDTRGEIFLVEFEPEAPESPESKKMADEYYDARKRDLEKEETIREFVDKIWGTQWMVEDDLSGFTISLSSAIGMIENYCKRFTN